MVLELFVVSEVPAADLERARDVLGGYCSQGTGWETVYHVHEYVGPRRPAGMAHPAPAQTAAGAQKDAPALWQQLDQALRKASYHINARYEVRRSDFPPASPGAGGGGGGFGGNPNLRQQQQNANPAPNPATEGGILRWIDFPLPPGNVGGEERGMLIQRKTIEIWEQKNLPAVLHKNKYQFKYDRFEHNILFRTREDVEFKLYRSLYPRDLKYYQSDEPTPGLEQPLRVLPSVPLEGLASLFPDDRWLLHVSVFVPDGAGPDEVAKAQERLGAVKREFEGVFQFRVIDRKVFDTRVPEERATMPAPLPQVIKEGH